MTSIPAQTAATCRRGRSSPPFFVILLERLRIDDHDAGSQYDPRRCQRYASGSLRPARTAASWEPFAGVDGYVFPMASMPQDRSLRTTSPTHLRYARGRRPAGAGLGLLGDPTQLGPPPVVGKHVDAVLAYLGLSGEEMPDA